MLELCKPSIKNQKLFFFFLFLISFSFNVSAQPPFTQILSEKVDIQFPLLENIEQNKEFIFNFHIFNSTTGILFDNTTHECIFHLFNNQGVHVIDQFPTVYEEFSRDFEANISGSNFSRIGEYSFLAICNSTGSGGSVSVRFLVTEDGLESVIEEANPTMVELKTTVLIIFFILILFIVGLVKLDPTLTALSGLLFMAEGVLIAINGISTYNDTFVNSFALLLIGLGMYIAIRSYIDSDEFQQV